MREFVQLRKTWDDDYFDLVSDFIDAGGRVAVRFIWRVKGRGPGSNVELTGVFTVRKGTINFLEYFWDHTEALEALGLSE